MNQGVQATFCLAAVIALGCSDSAAPDGPGPSEASVLASGAEHTCVLLADGGAACWGRWDGTSGGAASTPPVRVDIPEGTPPLVSISAGGHTCALAAEGRAYCWGAENRYGELGDGTTSPRDRPTPVATGLRFSGIAAGTFSTCGHTAEGRAYCWGQNDLGALGTGNMAEGAHEPSPVPVAGEVRFAALAGASTYCGLDADGRAYCWGASGSFEGLLEPGDCTTVYYRLYEGRQCDAPTRVAGDVIFASVAVGGVAACGVAPAGAAYCWGEGVLGTLGNDRAGTGTYAVGPVAVAGGITFASITAGATHVCGLTPEGRAYCWGNNHRGYLGNGEGGLGQFTASPVPVAGDYRFSAISAGWYHTCGLTTEGAVWCWGRGASGELGRDPSLGDSHVPVRVSLP